MRVTLLVAVALITVGVAYGQEKYEEKCTIATGNGVSVDSCDATKLLSCQAGYCKCSDQAAQLYDYRYVEQTSRTKRSPKKGGKGGGSKKGFGTGAVVGGAVGGAVGAYGGYQVGKAVANAGNGNGGSSTRYSSSSSESRSKKEYSCYGRVGSQCVLSYNNVNIVSLGTTTTTTTTTAATATNATENETTTAASAASSNETTTASTAESSTTAASPSASALTDISKIPKCVRNAVCQRPSNAPASNATATGTDRHVVQVDGDPRLGVCVCASGYVASKTDQCVKAPSGASNLSLGFSVIVFAVVSKLIN